MSSFQALMALSASQTKQSQGAVQLALQERQRKETVRRKEQEEKDRKDKEREAKLRLKHFEEQKKQEDRLRREEQKLQAMEAARQQREDEQRSALLYGPKKASKWPTSASGAKEAVRRSRLPSGDDEGADDAPAGSSFTREELRQRKLAAEQRRLYALPKRSSSAGYSKQGKRLAGGAVDITTTPGSGAGSGKFKSVKDRLAAQPMTLTKLNVVKRDTRTIDEIVQDRAKAKTLDGDKAREFSDWFGTSKKKDKTSPLAPASSYSSSTSSITMSTFLSGSQSTTSAVTSGTNTPVSQRGTPGLGGLSAAISSKKTPAHSVKQASITTSSKPTLALGAVKSYPSKSSSVNGKLGKSSATSLSSSQPSAKMHSHSAVPRKRPRSESRSESPQPKRRSIDDDDDDDDNNVTESIGSMIWNMFGRNRDEYISRDVFSDDEDMEADASFVAREEANSARIAAREDQIALEQERRHEEEKRRRKKEREARAGNSPLLPSYGVL